MFQSHLVCLDRLERQNMLLISQCKMIMNHLVGAMVSYYTCICKVTCTSLLCHDSVIFSLLYFRHKQINHYTCMMNLFMGIDTFLPIILTFQVIVFILISLALSFSSLLPDTHVFQFTPPAPVTTFSLATTPAPIIPPAPIQEPVPVIYLLQLTDQLLHQLQLIVPPVPIQEHVPVTTPSPIHRLPVTLPAPVVAQTLLQTILPAFQSAVGSSSLQPPVTQSPQPPPFTYNQHQIPKVITLMWFLLILI